MTDAAVDVTVAAARVPLLMVGDPSAAACDGEFCAIPDHHEQSVVNRRLDDDDV